MATPAKTVPASTPGVDIALQKGQTLDIVQIPYGSIVAVKGVPETDHAKIVEGLKAACHHQDFVVVFLDDSGAVAVLGSDQIVTALRATMVDEVSAETKQIAAAAAVEAVQPSVALVQEAQARIAGGVA